jgi:hypothetical protein
MLNDLLSHDTETTCQIKKCSLCGKDVLVNNQRNFGEETTCVTCFLFDDGGR